MATDDTNKINIQITVEDISLSLSVVPEDEPIYRNAAIQIQKRIQSLRNTFANQIPNEKYLYVMAMIGVYTNAIKIANKADSSPYTEMMNDLEKEMEKLGV